MNDSTIYYEDQNGLKIEYSPKMDGYWLTAETKVNANIPYGDFIDKRAFEDLWNADEKGKLSILRTLDSNVLRRIWDTKTSLTAVCNSIEVVRLKDEKERAEFN